MIDQSSSEGVTIDKFSLLSVIGKGSYAKVLLVRKKDSNKLYAMKALKKKYIEQKKQEEHIMTERNVLVLADHPFIVKLYYSFQNDRKLFFALEYCPGGELFNLLQKRRYLTEDQYMIYKNLKFIRARFYAAQIVLAMEYLHNNNIIYRDLKPENVLIDQQGYIRLTDFGLSKRNVQGEKDAFSVCGTPEYLAPEILQKQGHGKTADWWTLGCILFEMTTGYPPYYCNSRQELFERIKTQTPKYPSTISKNLRTLLEGLFQKKQEDRLGYLGAEQIKQSEWFQKTDWQAILQKQVIPPFQPIVNSESDTQNFDPEFTESAIESYKESMPAQSEGKQYYNFSYTGSMMKE